MSRAARRRLDKVLAKSKFLNVPFIGPGTPAGGALLSYADAREASASDLVYLNTTIQPYQGRILTFANPRVEAFQGTPVLSTPWVGLMCIHPDVAAYLLTLNTNNRKLSTEVVERYRTRMARGEWSPDTATPIIVSTEKVLLNGQHRLQAIVNLGLPIVCNVTFGADPKALLDIDNGKSRTVAVNAHLMGLMNSSRVVAAVNLIAAMLQGTKTGGLKADEVMTFVQENEEATQWFHTTATKIGLRNAAISGPLLFAYPTDPVKVDEFAASYLSGEGLSAGSPVLTLRNFVANNPSAADTRHEFANKAMAAIFAYLEGRALKHLVVNETAPAHFLKKYPEGSIVQSWKKTL